MGLNDEVTPIHPEHPSARTVLGFLKKHGNKVFFLPEVYNALKRSVTTADILIIAQEHERRGMVAVGTTRPFGEGYVLTWIDQSKPKEEALREALARIKKKREDLRLGAQKTVQHIMPFLEGGELILDVGCGGGRLSLPLAEENKTVVGLDISRQKLHQAREWATENNVDLPLILGAAERLPFKPCFEGLMCFFTLEFTSDPFKAVNEFNRVLEPNGRIVVSLLPTLDDHVRGSSYMRFTGQRAITNSLLPWEAISLLEMSGFDILKQEAPHRPKVPPEVRKWLDKNPRITMSITSWQVYGKKTNLTKVRISQKSYLFHNIIRDYGRDRRKDSWNPQKKR